jgi:hypothetical protein
LASAILLVIFFLPWVIKGSRTLFTWNLIRGGSLGRVLFLVWIPIAGVNLLALALLPVRNSALRAGLVVAIGVVPLVALCTTPLTFGQPPAAVPDTVGYGLLTAMPLLAFGIHHRAAYRASRVARASIVIGVALVLLSFFIPREIQEGTVVPMTWLFQRALQSAGWVGIAAYLVLPIPLSLIALCGISAKPRLDRVLRVLNWYFLRFIPGLFLLMAFPAFMADHAQVYRPYLLFVGATISVYLTCAVNGASALLARLYLQRQERLSPHSSLREARRL